MINLRYGGYRVEGKIPKAFNPNRPSKSRGLDLGYASAIVS
jgi:hypothetical protein